MANQIINAAPMVIDYGTEDLSTRLLPREPELIPQHCPKFFIWAKKGPTEPQLVVGAERMNMYGTETFDPIKQYHNHSTVFANLVNTEGNACMLQRLIPADAGPEANIQIYLEVLPLAHLDLYQRNKDGSYFKDSSGKLVITNKDATTKTPGFAVKFVTEFVDTELKLANTFGELSISEGSLTDASGNKSKKYPIAEFVTSFQGDYGNLSGIKLWAPTLKNLSAMPTKLMNSEMIYPYFISVVRKESMNSTPKAVASILNESRIMFSFKENVVDPTTGLRLNLADNFLDSYQNLSDLRYPKKYGDFGKVHVYSKNIDDLLLEFFNVEQPFFDYEGDFRLGYDKTYKSDLKHLINIISWTDSRGAPYHTLIPQDDITSTRWSENTQVFARGGSDGTMTDDEHALQVASEVQKYSDPESFLQELAVNVESVIYDTGFPSATKQALCDFISIRKDTFVILSTYDYSRASEFEGPDAETLERGAADRLKTYLQAYPESDYFGTPVMRGMVIGRNGKLRGYAYPKKLPLTAEIAIKSARYMGAGNGKWKNGKHFDGAPGSIVERMYDINIKWVSASVRNKLWDAGLNWIQPYDRRSFFFPALKTCYDDDTSVLNSYFTAMAICQLNKVAHAAWREFTGVAHLTNAQLAEKVNNFVQTRVQHRFDGRYVIVPAAMFTDMDMLRGYSWTLPIKIYSPNMKTVMTTYVQAFRIDDLQTTPSA